MFPLFLLVVVHMTLVQDHVYGHQLAGEPVVSMPGIVEGLLLGSFALHAIIGVVILVGNRGRKRARNPKTVWSRLQIASSIWVFVFMLTHITVSKQLLFSGVPGFIFSACFFAVGILGFAYHIGYGLFTFCLTWGIVRGEKSGRVCRAATAALGAAFLIAGYVMYALRYSEIWAVMVK